MKEAGFIEGQNVAIEYRRADGHYDRLPALAADLVRLKVTAIVATGGSLPLRAAKAATATIPILFSSGDDPVKLGIVASLSRPGGNATGVAVMTVNVATKRLGLLRDLVPGAKLIAVLVNPNLPDVATHAKDLQAGARAVGQQIELLSARSDSDFEPAFSAAVAMRAGALLVSPDPFFTSRRERLVALAAFHKLPAMYEWREFAEAGGLVSYGPSHTEPYRLVGIYTGRVLKGANPADLPVMQTSRFEFIINMKTAKALGLEVPLGLSAGADEVIE